MARVHQGLRGRDRLAASPIATLLVLLLLLLSGGQQHAPQPEPSRSGQGSLAGRVIVVDPGHGGNDRNRGDFGAEGVGPVPEKENVLAIGLALKRELEALGARVVMTRESDISPADRGPYGSDPLGQLKARVETARQVNPDAFISIHNDWSDDPQQEGVATFHYGASSRRLAEAVQRGLVAATGAKDRGVYAESFYVLRQTPGPAVLVETGFVSNPQEAYRLSDPAYRARIARGMAQGVAEVLGR